MSIRHTSLDWLLLSASLLLLATLVGAMAWGGAPADTPGALPHPDHGSILQATGPESPSLLAWGYAAGLSILFLMTVCIVLGVRKAGVVGALGRRLVLGCFGVALVFTALVWTYRGAAPDADFFGGLPPATAWMIYGVWWFPGILLVGMSVAFRRTWLTDRQVDEFRARLAEGEPAGSDGEPA